MKKTIWAIVAACVMLSCENDNSVNPAPLGTAAISGVVLSDLDENDNDDVYFERVPSVTVYAVLESEDQQVIYKAQTNAAGEYSITVPAGARARYFDVYVADFNIEINAFDRFDADGDPIYVKRKASYTNGFSERFSVILAKDQGEIVNLEISQPAIIQ